MTNLVKSFIKNESGATAIEYGLIASLVAVAAIAGMTTLGTSLKTTFTDIGGQLKGKN
ncbi:Flp family type IVb pilin [Bosea sp. (in: a-proteobacteria)]|uniref:Flp family type IVb pilin n=1 Tax=Bosea sp. (in: a-proteobacteria) TaxID=1871050 RepID=UPI002734D6D9|nr:Flp family type IVb pilin [Bosea sp. (in: a-proteobacteria)]MDP3407342.1 Flp family type IVb pilin [Bosea sp. (in: a-proteobacteria)]